MSRRSLLTAIPVLSATVAVDQAVKALVRSSLALGDSIHVFGPLSITHVANTGSVFGIGQGHVLVPTIASIIILTGLPLGLRWAHRHSGYSPRPTEAACFALIAGGAIGNLLDRLLFSSVTDFVDVMLPFGIRWPAFNVADSCIVVGTLMLLLLLYKRGVFDATADGAH